MGRRESAACVAFGPFRVNPETGELFKGDVRLRLSGQPFRILVILFTQAPEIVTREQLRQALWADDTFVDFEHGLNTAINRLRRVLSDSAQKPRYIETIPGRGYRFIAEVEYPPQAPHAEPARSDEVVRAPGQSRVGVAVFIAIGVVLMIATFVLSRWPFGTASQTGLAVSRLTADSGFTGYPSLSSDGNRIVYASDRSGDGRSDLFVQDLGSQSAVQITFDGEGNTTPDLSPDGERIVYRSRRNGGGIFETGRSGGQARRLVHDGFDPSYSPDGSMIAFWRGTPSVADSVPWSASAWIASSSGGPSKRIAATLTVAKTPMWLPDGKHLIVVGYDSDKAFQSANIDWWLVNTVNDELVRLPLRKTLSQAGLNTNGVSRTPAPSVPRPGCWLPTDSSIVFSSGVGDVTNVWSAGFSMSKMTLTGTLTRRTSGSGTEYQVSCSDKGHVAFVNLDQRRHLWWRPIERAPGTASVQLVKLTAGTTWHETPAISPDERHLAFTSFATQARPPSIWLRNMQTGTESQIAASNGAQRYPAIDHMGSRVAFTSYDPDGRSVYVARSGLPAERVCEGCFRATDWSPDDEGLLLCTGSPYHLERLHLRSRRRDVLLSDPNHHLMYGKYSPDGQWVSFTRRLDEGRGQITIAPINRPNAAAEAEWIVVASASGDDWANWSADGRMLYYSSSVDGHACLWGQRLHKQTKRLLGEPFALEHFHGRASFDHGGWSVAREHIVVSLLETYGNIWLFGGPARR